MAGLWLRFWGLSWWIKWPALGLAVIVVIAIIAAAATGGDDDEGELVSGQRTVTVEDGGEEPTAVSTSPPPTAAPLPTDTPPPLPADTPVPPPEPVVLEGVGQFATEPITLPAPISVAAFTHDGAANFIVTVFQGNDQNLLLNEIGIYRGSRPIVGLDPVVLDIDADGPWTLTISAIGIAGSPAFTGTGDAVSGLFDPPDTGPWSVQHNGQANFIVLVHCASDSDLVQNEIGSVSGSTVLSFGDGPCFWEVEADGSWSLAPR